MTQSEDAGGAGVTSDGVHRRQPSPGSDLCSKFFREAGGSLTGLLVTQEAAAQMKQQMPLLLSGLGQNEALMSQ